MSANPPSHPDDNVMIQPSIGGNESHSEPMSTGNSNDATRGAVGEKTGGLLSAIHGAGEAIRGTINSTLDGAGDAVAGRDTNSVDSRNNAGQSGETTAQKGLDELKEGYAKLTK